MAFALLSRPLLFGPTVWATVESVMFSELHFHEPHGGRGVANAFRHAAWNLLIARNCSVFTKKEKAVEWAKFTTNLHEECFPNEPFDQEMDLHNNRIGRQVFEELFKNKLTKKQMIAALVKKCDSAVGLTDEKEFEKHKNELVYFKD